MGSFAHQNIPVCMGAAILNESAAQVGEHSGRGAASGCCRLTQIHSESIRDSFTLHVFALSFPSARSAYREPYRDMSVCSVSGLLSSASGPVFEGKSERSRASSRVAHSSVIDPIIVFVGQPCESPFIALAPRSGAHRWAGPCHDFPAPVPVHVGESYEKAGERGGPGKQQHCARLPQSCRRMPSCGA